MSDVIISMKYVTFIYTIPDYPFVSGDLCGLDSFFRSMVRPPLNRGFRNETRHTKKAESLPQKWHLVHKGKGLVSTAVFMYLLLSSHFV
jgi:hypothetical protein